MDYRRSSPDHAQILDGTPVLLWNDTASHSACSSLGAFPALTPPYHIFSCDKHSPLYW